MSDINYITIQEEKGSVSISEDVLNVLVSASVTEVPGVAGFANAVGTDIADFLGIRTAGTKGIRISNEEGKYVIDLIILVRYGSNIADVARKVQSEVVSNIEAMTGMNATVNVHVAGISFEKSDVKG